MPGLLRYYIKGARLTSLLPTASKVRWGPALLSGNTQSRSLVTTQVFHFSPSLSSSNHNGKSVICNTQIVISDNGAAFIC